MAFQIETIPDEDRVFRHVPKARVKPENFWIVNQNRPSSAVFRDTTRRISVNWSKYETAEGSCRPNSLAIVSLMAGVCRSYGKNVEHTPIQEGEKYGPNQAHADICDLLNHPLSDEEEAEVRDILSRKAVLVWMAPGEPNFE